MKDQVIATIENLQAKVEVDRDGDSSILMIKVTNTDPAFAQKFANTIALAYKETHAAQQTRRKTEQLKYIVSQLGNVRIKLRNTEDEVNRFAQENELVSIDLQSENLLAQGKDLQVQIRKRKEDKVAIEGALSRLEGFIRDCRKSHHSLGQQYMGLEPSIV